MQLKFKTIDLLFKDMDSTETKLMKLNCPYYKTLGKHRLIPMYRDAAE